MENGVIVHHPIEDEEYVNDCRKAIGLESIEEYFKMMNEVYKAKK